MVEIEKEELHILETGLKNYILKEKSRFMKHGENNFALMKYRGLKFTINTDNPRELLFIVRIASLEASFRLRDGIKVLGSLGGDERLVYQWYVLGCDKSLVEAAVLDSKKKKKNSANKRNSTVEIKKVSFKNQTINAFCC